MPVSKRTHILNILADFANQVSQVTDAQADLVHLLSVLHPSCTWSRMKNQIDTFKRGQLTSWPTKQNNWQFSLSCLGNGIVSTCHTGISGWSRYQCQKKIKDESKHMMPTTACLFFAQLTSLNTSLLTANTKTNQTTPSQFNNKQTSSH